MKSATLALVVGVLSGVWTATQVGAGTAKTAQTVEDPRLVFHEVRYDARLGPAGARFVVDLEVEELGRGVARASLFAGDVALIPPIKLPTGFRIDRTGDEYRLVCERPGRARFRLEFVARVESVDRTNHVQFTGPCSAITAITAEAPGTDVELELLSGTVLDLVRTGSVTRLTGYLGPDRTVALRWVPSAPAVQRKAVVAVETEAATLAMPTVIRHSVAYRYHIMQGKLTRLSLELPGAQTLTRVVGDGIRDWQVREQAGQQLLTVELVRPIDGTYRLAVVTEQVPGTTPAVVDLSVPRPVDAERETGSWTVSLEDVRAEVESTTGLRRVNAPDGVFVAFRFSERPVAMGLKLSRIEPEIAVTDRVSVRLEEARLAVTHELGLRVEKAGVFRLEFEPDREFTVTDVRGEGVEDWSVSEGRLRVNFAGRVLGSRRLEVTMERALKEVPPRIAVQPLAVAGVRTEAVRIGVASAPGLSLKTHELVGLREVPVAQVPGRTGELLGYVGEQGAWRLALEAERLAPRVIADVFNLVTIGDGLVGGSAVIRYGIFNQGVQQFRVRAPEHFKNVEFTGPNIRRKEHRDGIWTITLQDKVWSGYTLVVTYDFQFDPAGAQLDLPGVHTEDTERETGSVAITRAANLELGVHRAEDPLRRIDEADLAPADRALITRPVLLAYRYAGDRFTLTLNVKRYPEMPVLSAVADRTQLITVLNEAGELLTQASFMVKNNDKQYQRFKLPAGARLWSCHVDNQAVTPERDGDWVLVPLPRGAAPDKAFAVDIVYAESGPVLKHRRAGRLALTAPATDVPNTYAEWELYVPSAFKLEDFTGNMTAVPSTVYTLGDAWRAFVEFYARVWRESGMVVVGVAAVLVLIALLCVSALRRGLRGATLVLGVVALVVVLAMMLLPSLATAKRRAVAVVGLNNLKQIGMVIHQFASANTGRTPNTLEELAAYMGGDEHTVSRLLVDPQSGERFVYVAPGVMLEELAGDAVIAYSPVDVGGRRLVLFADGHAESVPSGRFEELARRGFVIYATEEEKARRAQADAIQRAAMVETRKQESVMALPARGGMGGALAPAQPAAESTVSAVPAYPAQTIAGAAPAPVAAGVRSIRIDVPRSGRAYVFTKVLNVYEEPLQIRADLVSLRSAQRVRAVLQAGAFLIGLGLCAWQWRKLERSSFWVAVGLALVLGAVLDLTVAHRTLHFWMIVAVPVALVVGMVLLLRLVWRRWGVPEEVAMPLLIAALTVAWPAGIRAQATTPEPAQVAITSARYTGTVNDRVAQVDAEFNLISHAAGSRVRLFGGDVVICGFDASAKGVRLVRDGANVDVFLPQKGEVRLRVRLLVNVGGEPGRRVLAFGIPDALASRLSVVVAEPGADVDVPGAVSVSRDATGQQTRVEALIGARQRVELHWSPRVKRVEEVVATVICRNSAVVSLGSGVVGVRSTLDYQVLQGALRQLRVRLPVGHRLLRVEGESIRTWLVTNDSGPMLVVELSKAVAPAYRLVVETETGLGGLPGTVSVEIPHALDVRRESGALALRVEEELDLTVQEARGLDRIDAEEFARVAGADTTGLNGCFRFLAPDFTLRVGLAPVQPQIESKVHNHVMVGAEQTTLTATVACSVKRAGVFGFVLGLPAGYRVESVSAEKLLQWSEREVGGARVLDVAFKERVLGTRVLEVVLVQHYKELPKVVQVPGVYPWDVQKLSGFVSVSAEPGLVLRTRTFSGLTEIPVSALEPVAGADSGRAQRSRLPGSGLAFKFSVSEPGRDPAWRLDLDTEVLEPWVRAEVANVLAFQEGLVTGRALVRFDIQNAPTKQFTVRVPAAFRNVAVTGPDVRRVDRNGDLWRVELQNKVRGEYRLNVTWDQPLTNTTEMLELRGISVESVERETGIVALVARPPLQVAPVTASELLRADVREWPGWAGPAPEGMVLLYRYLRPGYGLTVNLQQFKPAEVLEAMVEQLDLGTVVSEDGQMMTYMQLAVRNTGRQFVEVALPEGSLCGWSAFVNGRAVRPGLRSGRLLIPLEPSGSDGAPVRVELTYVGTNKWPRTRGKVVFRSPVLDLPLKNARWVLYLPPDYRYRFVESGSTMKPEAGAAPERISFSLGEYMVREQMRMRSAAAALGSELATAKQKLARGQVREAYRDLSRVKGLAQTASVEDRSIKELDEELVRVQISNLQQAPLAVGAAGGAAQAGAPPAAARFDEGAAIAQWHKLQQAQETAGAEILPLRANLPTHGLKYTFAQVLQTEPGKPVAVELRVKNLRAPCWIARVAGVCAGFIVLWALTALVVRRRFGSKTRGTPPGATPS